MVSPVVSELVKLVDELELPLVVVVVVEQWLWQPPPPFAPTAKADGNSNNPTTNRTSRKAIIAFFKRFTSFPITDWSSWGKTVTRPGIGIARIHPLSP